MNGIHTSKLVGIARAFNLPDAEYSQLRKRADKLLEKAMAYGFSAEQLELIYVPARSEYDFESLLGKMHHVRKEHGCEWGSELCRKMLWKDKANEFKGFGIKDTTQFLVMLHGPERFGLHYIDMRVVEQVGKAKEFLDDHAGAELLSPAAYISANIVRVASGEQMLDDNYQKDLRKDIWFWTRFLQYSEDGFIETIETEGPMVPRMYVDRNGQFVLGRSYGNADPGEGIRFVLKESN